MGIRTVGHRRAVWACALVFVVALLTMPSAAHAVDAKFYYKKPASGSTTTTNTPKIAVYIVDRYGIKYSSNFRLYLDGVRKTPKISYKSKYRKVWVAYYPKTPLSPGRHKAVMKVKNIKGHWSTTSWTFTVPSPPPPPPPPSDPDPDPMPVTIEAAECHSCHIDTAWHPMDDCGQCHGAGRPVYRSSYSPGDESAHTPGCAAERPCHGNAIVFPHVLWSDCTSCHNGNYTGVSSSHAVEAEPAHLSTSALCAKSGCHLTSLTEEHYRYSPASATFTCATCHGSTVQRIRLAIESGSTRCESCHALTAAHVAPPALHGATGECILSGCHGGTALTLHGAADGPGCAACHDGGRTASLTCGNCHAGDIAAVHASASASHAAANASCISSQCHASDVAWTHSDDDGPGCVACHANGRTPTTVCAICHPGTIDTLHTNVGPAHMAPVSGCVSPVCHETDVMKLHNGNGVPGCGACHKAGARLTIACTTCHTGDAEQVHPGLASKHTAAVGVCTMGGCHGTKVAAPHTAIGGPGCVACHVEGKTPSTVCSACHAGPLGSATLHPSMTARHTVTFPGCVTTECHRSNAADLHGAAACGVCHSTRGATVSCTSCHGTAPTTEHYFAVAAHRASSTSCVSSLCHVSDVVVLHTKPGGPGCAACHANGKTSSVVCSDCHAGDIEAVHPKIGVSHTAPASGCVGTRCHVVNVTTVHNGEGVPGCGACHKAGTAATIACATCHPGDLTPRHGWAVAKHTGTNPQCQTSRCHVTDVASAHATGLGCVDCHGPARTASTTCGSCHPVDIASIHSKTAAKHSAPAGTCVSSICHGTSATELHKRLTYQGCPACHSGTPTATLVCRTCHTKTLVSQHATVAAVDHGAPTSTCVQASCHGADIAVLHSALPGEGCATCHVIGATPTQTCIACHTTDLTPRHLFATSSHVAPDSTCVTTVCHRSNMSTVHSQAGGPGCAACHAPGKTPSLICSRCHPTDISVVHKASAAKHVAQLGTCVQAGCHVTDVSRVHTKLDQPDCAACHLEGRTASLVCATCHIEDLTPKHPSGAAGHQAPSVMCVNAACHVSNISTIHDDGRGCSQCHALLQTPTKICGACHTKTPLALHPTATSKHVSPVTVCSRADCHGSDAAATHQNKPNSGCLLCHVAGSTPSATCSSCHTGGLRAHSVPVLQHTAATGACVQGGCHGSNAAVLHQNTLKSCDLCHVVGRDASLTCESCHTGDLGTLHPRAAVKHTALLATCVRAGCHASDVTVLHGLPGSKSCSACHFEGAVLSTDCTRCHPATPAAAHTDGNGPHTVSGSCIVSRCHGADVSATHSKRTTCLACHTSPGVTATAVCETCHAGDKDTVHVPYIGTQHTIASTGCKGTASCHNGDAVAIHTVAGEPRCFACHENANGPSLDCATCHGSGFPANHPAPPEMHTSTKQSCIQPGCHASNVGNAATLHTVEGGPGCVACHSDSATKSLDCVSCHNRNLEARHPSGSVDHAVSLHPCTDAGCHVGNVVTIHEQDTWSCWVCHDNETGEAQTTDCRTYCHGSAWASLHAGAQYTDFHGGKIGTGRRTYVDGYPWWFSNGYIKAPYTRGMSLTCSVCHVQAGTTNVFDFPLEINGTSITVTNRQTQLQNMCIACHGGSVTDWHASCFDPAYGCHTTGHGGDFDINTQDCSKCHHHGPQNWPHGRLDGFGGPTL